MTRQSQDCKQLVRDRGWQLVDTWTDNDVAVLKPGAARPEYDAMMAAAERGEVTRIVAYGLSRLWRNRIERAQAIDRLKQLRVSIALVKGSDLDLSSAAGRTYAGILGEFDTAESELKAERVARAAQDRAEEGKAAGHVLYGWRRIKVRNDRGDVIDWRDDIDPVAATMVREIVDRLLRGDTIKALVSDLNARKVPAPRGGRWLPSTARKIAMRRANIGRRTHHRGRPDETEHDAAWPPIIDHDKHDRVVTLLDDPARRSTRANPQRPGARKHLLSYGIGECGAPGCGARLRVTRRGGNELYVCDTRAGCVGRRREWVDGLVNRVMARRLAGPDARDLLTRNDGAAHAARERAAGIRARLDAAADDYAADWIDRDQLRRITDKLRPELADAERQASRAAQGVAPGLLAEVAGRYARKRWDALTVVQQRALLEALEVRVIILPARGGPGFKHESVRVMFGDGEQGTDDGGD